MGEKFNISNLNLYYGDFHALKDVDLTINEKEITAFIGPSGCGKSTFLKCLNRMNDLVQGCKITGQVLLDGEDIYSGMDVNLLRKRVGMVFQKPNPFPMSIYDNIAYGPRTHGIRSKAKLDEIVEKSLRGAAIWDEVKDRLNKSALGLSGGQQQRLCIARALAVDPEVILMDEPTSALDPISTSKIEDLAIELKKEYTIIIVTHNMQQAVRVSDDTAFFLVGEMLHGDYNTIVGNECLHSATNYECYKGLYSSFNSMNMFEIAHSIERQFGKEPWCLYTGKHLLTFVDNHDVSRIASTLTNKAHLPLIYALMFGMPGIPCIYYGSEWGCEAVKGSGNDNILRPAFDKPEYNELTDTISSLGQMYHNSRALSYGDYTKKMLTNRQYVFKREADGEKVLVAINADENEYTAYFDTECADALNLITGKKEDLSGKIVLPPYSFRFYRCM